MPAVIPMRIIRRLLPARPVDASNQRRYNKRGAGAQSNSLAESGRLGLNNSGRFVDFLKSTGRCSRSIPNGRLSPCDPFRRQCPTRSRTAAV